jgi:tetratricopeptide (TPR) repeat protein
MKGLLLTLAIGIAIAAEPDPPHIKAALAAFQAGVAAQRDHSSAKAIAFFLDAIEIEPTFLDPRHALIEAYQNAGKRLEAAIAITQLLEIEPSAGHYRLILAQMLLDEKQPDRALAQFSYLLRSDPYNADGLLGFASAAHQIGMEDRASQAIELGKKRYPRDERFKNWPPTNR